MLKRLIQILIMLFVLFMAASAMAEPLRIVTLALTPYGFIKDGGPRGLAFELGNALAEEAGLAHENHIVPLARGVADIAQGQADMIMMLPGSGINEVALNLGPILSMETVVIGRAGVFFNDIGDLDNKVVGAIRGAMYDKRIAESKKVTLYPCSGYLQSLKMLLKSRVDVVLGPKLGLYYTAKVNGVSRAALGTPLVLSVTEGCVFLSKQTPRPIAERLIKAMKRLKEKGTVEILLAKYSL